MRCYCCNALLSDKEATRRFKESGEFTDTCDRCLPQGIETITRSDVSNMKELDEPNHETNVMRFFGEYYDLEDE